MMVRWICGVSPENRMSSRKLNRYWSEEQFADVVRHGRLKWKGHFEQKDSDGQKEQG
jgi:hypothetical protein